MGTLNDSIDSQYYQVSYGLQQTTLVGSNPGALDEDPVVARDVGPFIDMHLVGGVTLDLGHLANDRSRGMRDYLAFGPTLRFYAGSASFGARGAVKLNYAHNVGTWYDKGSAIKDPGFSVGAVLGYEGSAFHSGEFSDASVHGLVVGGELFVRIGDFWGLNVAVTTSPRLSPRLFTGDDNALAPDQATTVSIGLGAINPL